MKTITPYTANKLYKKNKVDDKSFTSFVFEEILMKGDTFQVSLEDYKNYKKWTQAAKRYNGIHKNEFTFPYTVDEDNKALIIKASKI